MISRLVRAAAAVAFVGAGLVVATTATPSVASGASKSGCGTTPGVGSSTLALTINGHVRTVIVHVPSTYRSSTPAALVLNMHGTGATALDQDVFSGMNLTADADGFLVAYPQALVTYAEGYAWNVPGEPLFGGTPVPTGSANDVSFLVALVRGLEARYCVNRDEVYATGFSGGARMASQLACDASRTFAAIAAVSGLRRPTPCPTTRAVPVIAFHGLADHVDPYAGHGQGYWTYSVPTALKDWAHQDGCGPHATVTTHAAYTFTQYAHCAAGSSVELYSIDSEGHEWPGGPTMPLSITQSLGPQSDALSADSLMWSFFTSHRL
ncbi:MAG: alpha/beta hydrolase family esterase [Acidimicrobiales bacterium]